MSVDGLPVWFDSTWYCQQYPDVAAAGVDPYDHYMHHGVKEGRLPCPLKALEWDGALWQQTDDAAECVQALHHLLEHANPLEASFAGFALGRWYAWKQEWTEASRVLACRPMDDTCLPNHSGPALLEIEADTRSGAFSLAWRKIAQLRAQVPDYKDTFLAVSNLLQATAEQSAGVAGHVQATLQAQRLAWLNNVWLAAGLVPVALRNRQQPLSIDNLDSVRTHRNDAGGPVQRQCSIESATKSATVSGRVPLVSVIVPVFNAGDGVLTALRSLAAQTLRRRFAGALEVIVVDDASTDNTVAVAEAFAAQTPGFRLLRQPENLGAYAARNRGLAEAKGECITVHDSDDWSHPQKLEIQWRGLQQHPEWVACNSYWVRCTSDLVFTSWRMEQGWIYRNTSSLMFRRKVFETLGYWDRVRVEADTEYHYRIQAAFGPQSLGEVLPGVPLAFGRVVPTALTMQSSTHLVTQFSGVRADYRKASEAWHRAASAPEDLYLPETPINRPFWAPVVIIA
ncbi:glycosyltransferase [Halomonas qinghailakensis]|uniref:Glycosyltransferase n=1 Tax=Halomonas qinghailakensis TaxID=2937790 RepID=A0AA46TP06_9GAMM|nr:glycosyltransferase family 2 protein [Halomonas sp. ZZQ-149]UYO73885.1 glycosyltransferase [Halomonas sp. ZZQ-149]